MLPLLFAAATHGAGDAPAPASEASDATAAASLPAAHALRRGLVMGFSLGAGLGGASGYPNNSQDIGNPDDYSASSWMFGSYGALFVMGALSDYLNVGFWYGHSSLRNPDWQSSGDGAGLRMELFPLVGAVPALSGLGVLASFGLGSGKLSTSDPRLPSAGGTQSYGAAGLFHEWAFGRFLGGHFAAGPSLELDAIWSQPFEQHGLVAGARVAFYGGP